MPTYETTRRFDAELDKLTPAEKAVFEVAVQKLVHNLRAGQLRKGLRIKPFRGKRGLWELTWAADGRALFRYGDPVRPGHVHVIWVRIGGHEIFDDAYARRPSIVGYFAATVPASAARLPSTPSSSSS